MMTKGALAEDRSVLLNWNPSKYDALKPDDVLMLGQRRRRWANIKTSLFQRVVFTGTYVHRRSALLCGANRKWLASLKVSSYRILDLNTSTEVHSFVKLIGMR